MLRKEKILYILTIKSIKRLFNVLESFLHIYVECVFVCIHIYMCVYIFFKDFEAITPNTYVKTFQFNASNARKRKYFGVILALLRISSACSESQNPL